TCALSSTSLRGGSAGSPDADPGGRGGGSAAVDREQHVVARRYQVGVRRDGDVEVVTADAPGPDGDGTGVDVGDVRGVVGPHQAQVPDLRRLRDADDVPVPRLHDGGRLLDAGAGALEHVGRVVDVDLLVEGLRPGVLLVAEEGVSPEGEHAPVRQQDPAGVVVAPGDRIGGPGERAGRDVVDPGIPVVAAVHPAVVPGPAGDEHVIVRQQHRDGVAGRLGQVRPAQPVPVGGG